MPVYVTLFKWTDQGREKVSALPERAEEVERRADKLGVKIIGNYVTMGRYDQVSVVEAPDDETAIKILLDIAGRGNASSETLRAWTMEEVRGLM
jgi:uncharacterized protein with GYD domain